MEQNLLDEVIEPLLREDALPNSPTYRNERGQLRIVQGPQVGGVHLSVSAELAEIRVNER
jgi:hypothetical protein